MADCRLLFVFFVKNIQQVMEQRTEIVTERELTQYEIERNKPVPSLNHSLVQGNLLVAVNYRCHKQYTILSEIDLIMPEKPNAVPDIAIYPKLQIDFLEDKTAMSQLPLTTIEILSPSQTEGELVAKAQRYFAAGVKSCKKTTHKFHSKSPPGEYPPASTPAARCRSFRRNSGSPAFCLRAKCKPAAVSPATRRPIRAYSWPAIA